MSTSNADSGCMETLSIARSMVSGRSRVQMITDTVGATGISSRGSVVSSMWSCTDFCAAVGVGTSATSLSLSRCGGAYWHRGIMTVRQRIVVAGGERMEREVDAL